MIRRCARALTVLLALAVPGHAAPDVKGEAVASVERQRAALVEMADRIWEYAETALEESRSAEALAAYAEGHGFRVRRGVAGMPTAFVAEYGRGRPVIALLGEYDALAGLSQERVPRREPRAQGGAGHGCGHNLFGPASLGAAVAVKQALEAGGLRGTVRFYGTPAEEAVGGKIYMAREGLFDDVDAVLAWHPDFVTRADTRSSQAIIEFEVAFHGRAAHAAFDPWNGRSALDGLEIFQHALNLMREHVRPTVRMHYSILDGGGPPNVVPETARLWFWVRDSTRAGVENLRERIEKMARGAALAADVQAELSIRSGSYEMLPSFSGARVLHENLERLGPLEFTGEQQELARAIQRAASVEPRGMDGTLQPFEEEPPPPDGGSTDVADLSWLVPTIHLVAATAPAGVPWHAWPVVVASGTSLGHDGMVHASKALAATAVDLFREPAHLEAMRAEFREKTAGQVYEPYIPDGPPPVPVR